MSALRPCGRILMRGRAVTPTALRSQALARSSQRSLSLGRCASVWLSEGLLKRFDSRTQMAQFALLHTTTALGSDVVDVEGPAFAESITEGDINWIKQVGDFVNADEVVAEIETDKTAVEVPSPQSGTIVEHLVGDGDKVTAKQKLFKLKLGDAPAGGAAPAADTPKSSPEPTPPPPPPTPKPASGAGPIPTTMPPVPPIPTAPLPDRPTTPLPPPPAASRPPPAPAATKKSASGLEITGERLETRVKMNRMRNRIASRLKEAQNTYAMLTTFNEIDMSAIIALRNKNKDAFLKKHGVKFGFMSPFLKAAAYALQDQPVVNAVIEGEDMVYRHFVDISVAVATPRGLVVPVLRNVEQMGYADIELALNELGVKARDGKITVEDMDGGTFTVSNGGVFGSLYGTPIINPPQSAILGMHAIVDKPVAIDGKVEIRPIMVVALTYDHRLIDGREAVTFLRKIKQAVEDPASMLMHL